MLITLGIIGIVAALTIPNLIAKYQQSVLKTQFMKKYAEISQAVLLAKGETNLNFNKYCTIYNRTEGYYNSTECKALFNKYFKVIGTCEYEQDVLTYNKQNKTYVDIGAVVKPQKLLADGTCYDIKINSGELGFTFDMNGPNKGPNALGHDIFTFLIDKNDYLQPIKQKSTYTDDEIENMISDCAEKYPAGGQSYSSCIATAGQKGNPCRKNSNQIGNGLGCSWYAYYNICPDDNTKTYWDCLP